MCQHVFNVRPSDEMMQDAFASVEGAPRLLLLLLWAMQASPGDRLAQLLPAELKRDKIRTALSTTNRDELSDICKRAMLNLQAANVVTFTENVHKHRLHLIFALALLGRVVPLAAKLEENLTVAQVIAHGLALSLPDPNHNSYPLISEAVVLYTPLIYWRYLQKVGTLIPPPPPPPPLLTVIIARRTVRWPLLR